MIFPAKMRHRFSTGAPENLAEMASLNWKRQILGKPKTNPKTMMKLYKNDGAKTEILIFCSTFSYFKRVKTFSKSKMKIEVEQYSNCYNCMSC